MPTISPDGNKLFVIWRDSYPIVDTCYGYWNNIYVLHRLEDGTWTPPKNLGENVNVGLGIGDFCISPDLKEIYICHYTYLSGDKLFWSFREDTLCDTCWVLEEPFSEEILEYDGTLFGVSISGDGLRLYPYHFAGYFINLQRDSIGGEWYRIYDDSDYPSPGPYSGMTFTADMTECFYNPYDPHDIHYSRKIGSEWTEGIPLGNPPNTPDLSEWFGVSISPNGNELYYFTLARGLYFDITPI